MAEDNNNNTEERVSANPGGLDEHRPLTTGDLDLIAEYVKGANKSSSGSRSKSSSRSRSKSSGGSRSKSSGGSKS